MCAKRRRRRAPPGSTCSPRNCSPRRNGSEISRATASERPGSLFGRAGGCRSQRLERLFLFTRRPDRGRLDPRGRGPAGVLEPAGLRARPYDYFGADGWADPGAIRMAQRSLVWSFWFLVPDGWLRLVWCGCLVVLGLYTLGLFSRLTALLSWVIVVSTVRRVPIALYGFDQILSTLTLYLGVTGASGQAVSLDRFWRRWRQARAWAPSGCEAVRQRRPSCLRPMSRVYPHPRSRRTWPCD